MPQDVVETSEFIFPVQVPAGTDPAGLQYLLTAFQNLVNRTNFLKGRADLALSRLGEVDPNEEWVYTDAAGLPAVRGRVTVIHAFNGMVLSGTATSEAGGGLIIQSNYAKVVFDLSGFLPDGAMVNGVRALVKPGIARATLADRMSLSLDDVISNYSTYGVLVNNLITNTYDNGTAVIATMVGTPSPTPMVMKSQGNNLIVTVKSGVDAAVNNDTIYSILVEWTDPGPRNF